MIGQFIPYLLVAFCLLVLAAGQILFKIVGTRLTSITDLFTDWTALGLLVVAVGLYGASTLAWIVALRTLPLIHAYIFLSLGFILVPFAAHFLLNEPLTIRLFVGSLIVMIGIIIAVT